MNDLANFILARIAEDEERGHSLVAQWFDVGNACQSCGTDGARLLAECDAKRRIVEHCHWGLDHYGDDSCGLGDDAEHNGGMDAVQTLRLLALPYADHPDFQQEWAE